MAVQGLDTNGDGVFSKEELKPLAEVNVNSLKDFDYFTFVHIGDADNLPLKPPEDYWLDYEKALLTLHFTLPLETPLDTHGQPVQVDVYDPSFFVAFGFAIEAPVKLSGDRHQRLHRGDQETRRRVGGGRQGSERSFFQSAWPQQQFRLPVCPDGGGEMRQRSFLGRTAAAFLLLAVALLVVTAAAHAEAKPLSPFAAQTGSRQSAPAAPPSTFAPPSAPSAFGPPQAAPLHAPGALGAIVSWVVDTQQTMQGELATGVMRLKTENAFAAAVGLAALSFLYGVIHAVGPGHGKTIISSYVVANEETVRRGVLISFIAAAMQAVTAVALVGVLAIALNASGMAIKSWSLQLESVSYALIALVGLWLLTT